MKWNKDLHKDSNKMSVKKDYAALKLQIITYSNACKIMMNKLS